MSARLTLSTGSLYGYPLDRVMARAARLGLDGLEVLLTDALLDAGPDALRAQAERHGLPILSLHFPLLGRRDDDDLHWAYARSAEFAARLPACEAVVVHTPLALNLHTAEAGAYLRALREAQAALGGGRARLAIENRGVGHIPTRPAYLDDLANLRRLAEEWDLHLTYDVGHAASWGLDIVRALETLGPRVRNIHLSNSQAGTWTLAIPLLHSHFRDHQPLQSGVLPLASLLQRLAAARYDGLLTLEISPVALHLPTPLGMGARLAESVRLGRSWLARADATDGRPRPTRRRDVMHDA